MGAAFRVNRDETNPAYLVGQGCTQRVRGLSIGGAVARLDALTVAAEGGNANIVKPLHGLGAGVFEIALPHWGDAFRVVMPRRLETISGLFMLSRRRRRKGSRHRSARSIWLSNG